MICLKPFGFRIIIFAVEDKHATGTQLKTPVSTSRTDEEVLRDFDLTSEYGPCIGTDIGQE